MKKVVFMVLLLVFLAGSSSAEIGYTVASLKSDIQFTTKGDLGLPDSIWMEAMNSGIQTVASLTDCVIDTERVDISSGTFEYALPANFQKLWHAINLGTQRVYDVTSADQRGQAGTGMEVEEYKIYTYASSKIKGIGFFPTPTATDSVLVYYYATPVIVDASTDTVDIAEAYQPAVPIACRVEIWERVERWDKANRDRALLINEINNIRAHLNRQPDVIIAPRMIEREH